MRKISFPVTIAICIIIYIGAYVLKNLLAHNLSILDLKRMFIIILWISVILFWKTKKSLGIIIYNITLVLLFALDIKLKSNIFELFFCYCAYVVLDIYQVRLLKMKNE